MEFDFDKKLVKDGKLCFKLNEDKSCCYTLTDDGMVEYTENGLLESVKPFSKLTLTRDCKLKMQEGYEIDNNDVDLVDAENSLKQQIDAVDKVQDLKNELEDKVDKLVNESNELDGSEYCVVEYEAKNPNEEYEIVGVVEQDLEGDSIKWVDDNKVIDGDYEGLTEEEAYKLKEKLDEIHNTWTTTSLKHEVKNVKEAIQELKADLEKRKNIWYSTEGTTKVLNKQDILALPDDYRFTILQKDFIENKGDLTQQIIYGLKHLANSFDDETTPIISIDDYIKEVYDLDSSKIV